MIDNVLLLLSLVALACLGTLAAASGRGPFARPRVVGVLLFGLLIAYAAFMAWGWARRAAEHERSTRALTTNRQGRS